MLKIVALATILAAPQALNTAVKRPQIALPTGALASQPLAQARLPLQLQLPPSNAPVHRVKTIDWRQPR